MRRDGEVNYAFASRQFAVSGFENHWLAAIAAECLDYGVLSERGRNAQSIPDADTPISVSIRFHAKTRRHSTKRVCGPNVAVIRRQNQHLAGGKMPESLVDVLQLALQRLGNLRCLGNPARAGCLPKHIEPHIAC